MATKFQDWLARQKNEVVEIQARLTAAKALGPENGGQGELGKALVIQDLLSGMDIGFTRHDCPDPRVESGLRPNIVAVTGPESMRKLWLFAHMDVVPAGDALAWSSDPFCARQNGDLVFGRGVEDNQQAIVSMILLARAVKSGQLDPQMGLGLVFISDEETGSRYGLDWLLERHGHLFSPEDYYIVPDGGSPSGELMEIAEKAQLWLKFEVLGKQCHASMPQEGINSLVASSALVLELVKGAARFPLHNPLFLPPASTFVPTLHEENVPAANILPGKDVFYMDCRLLPGLDSQKVISAFDEIRKQVAAKFKVEANMEIAHWQPATYTDPHAEVIRKLSRAIESELELRAKLIGIGGVTVAQFLRRRGLPAVVWSTLKNTCHQPNEHSSITDTFKDISVFAHMLTVQ